MPSPFPGMDPYLEAHWRDVHSQLVTYASAALNGRLPDDLVARVEERVAGPGVAEPIVLDFDVEEYTQRYVAVIGPDGQLVTVIEFLSASNKVPREAREQYRRKRSELLAADVNLVEVDLLRQGAWRELLRPAAAPARADSPYRVITRRVHSKHRIEMYPIQLRQRLPAIRIPLRPADKDAVLDLQDLVDQAYRNGRYDHTDYSRPCDPPLDPADAQWADELLRKAGLRAAS